MLKRWVRDDVLRVLSRGFDVRATLRMVTGGDYDCPPIIFRMDGVDDAVYVTPYLDPEIRDLPPVEDRLAIDVFAVELRTADGDCRGGLQTHDEGLAMFFGACYARLCQLGFRVIGHYDEIF